LNNIFIDMPKIANDEYYENSPEGWYEQILDGWGIPEISKVLDLEPMEIYQGLKGLGVADDCAVRFPRSGVLDFWYEDAIDANMTIDDMAEFRGVRKNVVEVGLCTRNLTKRYRERHPFKGSKKDGVSDEPEDEYYENSLEGWYEQVQDGWRISEISKALDLEPKEVYQGLKELGVIEECMENFPHSGVIKLWYEDCVESGLTWEQMAEERGTNKKKVVDILSAFKLTQRYREKHPKPESDAQRWRRQILDKKNVQDIARESSVDPMEIYHALRDEKVLDECLTESPRCGLLGFWYEQCVEDGLTDEQIANERGIGVASARTILGQRNLLERYREKHPVEGSDAGDGSDEGDKQYENSSAGWHEQILDGWTVSEIAEELDLEPMEVYRGLMELGAVKECMESSPMSGILDLWYEQCVADGFTKKQMAEFRGVSERTILAGLKDHGLVERYMERHPRKGSRGWYEQRIAAGLTREQMAEEGGIQVASVMESMRIHKLMEKYRERHPRKGSDVGGEQGAGDEPEEILDDLPGDEPEEVEEPISNSERWYGQISQGKRILEMARESGVDPMEVYQGLKEQGVVDECVRNFPGSGILGLWYEDGIDAGLTIEGMAKLRGVRKNTIEVGFNYYGLTKKYRKRHPIVGSMAWYEQGVENGLTTEQMARLRDVDENTVRAALKKHGLTEEYEKKHAQAVEPEEVLGDLSGDEPEVEEGPPSISEGWYGQISQGKQVWLIAQESGVKPMEVYQGLKELRVVNECMENFQYSGIIKLWYEDCVENRLTEEQMAELRDVGVETVRNALRGYKLKKRYRELHPSEDEFSNGSAGEPEKGSPVETPAERPPTETRPVERYPAGIRPVERQSIPHQPNEKGSREWYEWRVDIGDTITGMAKQMGVEEKVVKRDLKSLELMERYMDIHRDDCNVLWVDRYDWDGDDHPSMIEVYHHRNVKDHTGDGKGKPEGLDDEFDYIEAEDTGNGKGHEGEVDERPEVDEPEGLDDESVGSEIDNLSGDGSDRCSGVVRGDYATMLREGWSVEEMAKAEHMNSRSMRFLLTEVARIIGKDELKKYEKDHPSDK
jgi:DNA-binding CsgD family transcriptional regulator